MPTYVYENCDCEDQKSDTVELNVPIEQRDSVSCGFCGRVLKRKIVFTGLTWAPTAGGMK